MKNNGKKPPDKKPNKSKQIGNAFERKMAKELSIWMFDDPHTLKREPTSGATKDVYIGDIYPMKQMDWNCWPFQIETKYGYTNQSPTLINYKIIEKWFLKAHLESKEHDTQKIILLITNFKDRKGIMLICNCELYSINWRSIIKIKHNGCDLIGYVYDYAELLKTNFDDVFKH